MAGRVDHLDRLESDVSEVTHLLRENVEKVATRGEKLDDLQTRSEELQSGSHHFKRQAVQVKRKMCWQNCKMNCIIALVVIGVLVVVVVIVIVSLKPWENSSDHKNNSTIRAIQHST